MIKEMKSLATNFNCNRTLCNLNLEDLIRWKEALGIVIEHCVI